MHGHRLLDDGYFYYFFYLCVYIYIYFMLDIKDENIRVKAADN